MGQMENKLIIGVVGRSGAGKGTLAQLLVQKAIASGVTALRITFSDLLGRTLDDYGIERNRDNLQQLALFVHSRRVGGLSYNMRNTIQATNERLVVVDGIRWQTDYDMIREFPNNKIIFIDTTNETRFARLIARGHKPGESEMTYENFLKSEQVATETAINHLTTLADVRVDNNSDLATLQRRVDQIWTDQVASLLLD